MIETIVAAACRIRVPKIIREELHGCPENLIVSAPPPARHHSLLHPFYKRFGQRLGVDAGDQGFLTSTGRYVGREEALKIALASGQPMIDHPSRHDRLLFSEDLW